MSTFKCNNCNREYPVKGALGRCKCGKGNETLATLNEKKEAPVSKPSYSKKKTKLKDEESKEDNTTADLV